MAAASIWQAANATLRSCAAASSELPQRVKNLPEMYAEYVASNAQSVGQVESTLRSLTYLLPGARLNDSELPAESVHTFVQLLSIYHDHLLKKRAKEAASKSSSSESVKVRPSRHARYTMFWADSSTLYEKVATILKVVQYTELLCEMTARKRGGERSRWRVVVFLESFKALLRMILLRLTNSRPVVTPPLPLRDDFAPADQKGDLSTEVLSEDDLKLLDPIPFEPREAFSETGILTPPMSDSDKISIHHNPADPFLLPRTGFTMPSMPSPDYVSSYLFEHIITPDDIKPVKQLVHRLTSFQGQAAEVLYILRPLIYAILVQRLARQYGYEGSKWKRNWSPWLIGLTVEYFARQLAKHDLASRVPGARNGLSALERDEFTKRGWNIAWWGMRGAFYENVTKRAVMKVSGGLKGKPLLDLVGGVIEDYEHLWGNYWFSTSTM
ncbi:hypothetical protein LTR05_003344 [Lithohypha guttulata]|uniref:Peroxisomal membrane protein PEX16 n=1 Tax=Lithohypha guttulata TaxID=1690604 RepID=A0AAN7T4I0_9EURO|nr:hypothetical protein LTR05_003344 [Lithohypha guttulata]